MGLLCVCRAVKAEAQAARGDGRLTNPLALVGHGRMFRQGQPGSDAADLSRRGDQIGWFDGTEAGWRMLGAYLELLDHFVALAKGSGVPAAAELHGCTQRSRAMVACYPGSGARYAKHCDNACANGAGPECNGRRLTAILYLNTRWRPADGGELVLFPPVPLNTALGTASGTASAAAALGHIAPCGNRLVLFWSDARVPHEVLPAHAERYAVTCWYYDETELRRANERC